MASLPTGYKQLEYIESNGKQYINTGFKPDQNTSIRCTATFTSVSSNSWLFGARTGTPDNARDVLALSSGKIRADYDNQTYQFSTIDTYDKLTIEFAKNSCDINGEKKVYTAASISPNLPIYLFATNNSGSVFGKCSARLYNLSIENNGVLSHDFIPCKNQSDEVGLYDLVTKSFYGNSGTGNFVAGPEVITAPDTPGSVSQRTAVALIWGAVECEGYRVYKNSNPVATTTQPNYVDYAVGDGETIEYEITAFNGELESESVKVSVTVKEGYTALLPIVNSAFFL